MLHNFISQIDI